MPEFKHPVFKKLEDYTFYLCSTSPRRLEILNMMGFKVTIRPSNFEENLNKSDFPKVSDYALNTAVGKMLDVWDDLKSNADKTPIPKKLFMLASDTIVENDNNIYEKPKSSQENYETIKMFRDSDKPVTVISGVVLLLKDETTVNEPNGYKILKFTETSTIKMNRNVSDNFIKAYSESEEGLKVAGGFKIQGFGGIMMTAVDGDFYNIVGLPYSRTFTSICDILGVKL